MATIIGNIGSIEDTFLKSFPSDFRYILARQVASLIGISDDYVQATWYRSPQRESQAAEQVDKVRPSCLRTRTR